MNRYGSGSVDMYKENLDTLFTKMKEVLPETCLVIWNMTLPISKKARGGFLIPQVEYMNSSLRLDILEANFYVHKVCYSGCNLVHVVSKGQTSSSLFQI